MYKFQSFPSFLSRFPVFCDLPQISFWLLTYFRTLNFQRRWIFSTRSLQILSAPLSEIVKPIWMMFILLFLVFLLFFFCQHCPRIRSFPTNRVLFSWRFIESCALINSWKVYSVELMCSIIANSVSGHVQTFRSNFVSIRGWDRIEYNVLVFFLGTSTVKCV